MDKLPYELLFSIALRLDSPKDVCSFSRVSSLFLSVARDERIWKRFSYRLYNIKLPLSEMKQSFYDLFTKTLVPYGRYLGYWKSSEKYLGGLIHVHLDISNGNLIAEKYRIINASPHTVQHFFIHDDDEDDDDDEESSLKPVYNRKTVFTIDSTSHQIFCHDCNMPHDNLPWTKTFNSDEQYFGLSQEALPVEERSSLVAHDHNLTDVPDGPDIYFVKDCSNGMSLVYHPLSVPQPTTDHPLSCLNGLWVGTYGGHGLEILHLELCHQFTCPPTADGERRNEEIVSNALVARKITGDRNVPHGKISFAAVRSIEGDPDSPARYEGVGQIAHTNYISPQFIRTEVAPISENVIKVTWYALHHSSFFERCPF